MKFQEFVPPFRIEDIKNEWDELKTNIQKHRDFDIEIKRIQAAEISTKEEINKHQITKLPCKILSWNVNGWKYKPENKDDFSMMIKDILMNDPHIVLLQKNNKDIKQLKTNFTIYYIEITDINEKGFNNVIMSKYPFSAISSLKLPKVSIPINTDDYNTIFKQCKNDKKLFGFFGGADKKTEEFVKEGNNSLIVSQFKFKNNKQLSLVNLELLETPTVFKKDQKDNKNGLTETCKEKIRYIYEKTRLAQFNSLYNIFHSSKDKVWFGSKFTNAPRYRIIGGNFNTNYKSKIIEKFKNNYLINEFSLPENNTEFIGLHNLNDPNF